MLGVVSVGNERNNRGDCAVLCHRRGNERGDVTVAGEVTGAAGAVHDAGAANVGGVDVAVNIGLNHAVGGDKTHAADNLRVVGDLLRTQDDVLAVALCLSVHLLCVFRGKCKGGSGSDSHLAGVDKVKHAVLDDLSVCLNVFKLGLQQACHHSVRDITHAGLHDELVILQASSRNLALEELDEVSGDLLGNLIRSLKWRVAVRSVGLNDCDDLFGRQLNVRGTNAVINLGDRDWLAVRQLLDLVNVVHALEVLGLPGVYLENNLVCSLDVFQVIAHCRRRDDVAVFQDADNLDDCDLEVTVEALFNLLARVGQVDVLVKNLTGVCLVTQNRIGVVRGAEAQSVCLRQNTVTVRSGGSTGEEIDLEFFASCVCSLSLFSDGGRQRLWIASSGEAGDSDAVTVVDKLCSLVSRNNEVLKWRVCDPIGQGKSSFLYGKRPR